MGTINPATVSDGESIDASDLNSPINTIANEINGNLDNDNIDASAAIDASKLAGGVSGMFGSWSSWTPTLTNHTASSTSGAYIQIGKTVHFYLAVVLNAAPSGGFVFSAPVTMNARYANDVSFHSTLDLYENGVRRWSGCLTRGADADKIELKSFQVSGTGVYQVQADASTPFTWASGDVYYASGSYEAA